MTRYACGIAAWICLLPASATPAGEGAFDGEWRTSFGTVNLEQTNSAVTGAYGDTGQFTLEGTVQDDTLTFEYEEGEAAGDGEWTLDESGLAFHGRFQLRGGRAGRWDGWRPDPAARSGDRPDLGGLWLTDIGLMELEQSGEEVQGRYAVGGVSEIAGTLTWRSFEFEYKAFRPGNGWFDVAPDGDTFAGAASNSGFAGWYGWQGRRAPEFSRHAALIPGEIVDGSTNGLLTYAARAPEDYTEGDGKEWPAIVILHGSNMNGRMYVNTIAQAWPDVARDYLLIGINGERPSSMGDEPRFNYTYVNYVGRSTFRGYPGTDREGPALVAEALQELRETYAIARYFVGGHSQGGFLTYSLLMNFPEQIAGAFPISAGVIFQCEPGAYADDALSAAQRSVPLAIIHGKNDPAVSFSTGQYAATLFGEAGWPAFRFFADESGAGHMFARLPVAEAIRWIEVHASNDPARLVEFAEERVESRESYRDAIAALNRARALMPDVIDDATRARLDLLQEEIDTRARAGAEEFLPKIRNDTENTWIDDFLAFRHDFEFAPAAREVMQAFDALRAEHNGPAGEALSDARAAFRQGRRDDGYALYDEIVERYFAAACYRNVKRWLAERE